MQRISFIDIFLIICLALIWGSTFLLIKIALVDFLPLNIVFWRLLIASVVLGGMCWRAGVTLPRQPRIWVMIAALGVIANSIPFYLVSWSETKVESNFAAIVVASVPLWTAVMIPLFIPDEKMTRRRFLGLVVGFLGVLVLTGGFASGDFGDNILAKTGLLISAVCYAIGVIIIRRLHHLPAEFTAFGMNFTAWLAIVPVVIISADPVIISSDWGPISAVIALGIFTSATASIILVRLIVRIGAGRATVTNYLVPPVAAILGILFLDEILQPETLIGLVLILLGVWISSRRPNIQTAR